MPAPTSNLPVSIRLNPFKSLPEDIGKAVPWSEYGRILDERPVFTLDPLFHAGCYYVQDSSAMFVGHIFRKMLDRIGHGGLRVLDLCAAPGGKTTDIAASLRLRYGDDFLLVSNEVMKERARILSDNIAIWGDPNIYVCSADPAVLGRAKGFFDIIVADVPCSGEGMFRKDAKAVEDWSEQTVQLCASRQRRILADIWPALKTDGILVYSTCTYEKAENDGNLVWAADTLGGEIVEAEDIFAGYGVKLTAHGNILRAGESLGEGQWVGALIKTSCESTCRPSMEQLPKPLRYGVYKGEQKGRKFVPDNDYALSLAYNGEYPSIEASREEALRFLHHDALRFPDSPLGYNAICYLGHPLGFVNNLGTRCNNLHPNSRRILMNIK